MLGIVWGALRPASATTGASDPLPYKVYLPQVYKQAGPTATVTPIPGPTEVPQPTETSIPFVDPSYIQRTPGAFWHVVQVNMLPCERSSGSHVIYITTVNHAGAPVDGINIVVQGQSSGIDLYGVSGDKAPGKTEVPVSRDGWDAWVTDNISDKAMNMREDLPNDPNCSGRFGNHYEYEVVFMAGY